MTPDQQSLVGLAADIMRTASSDQLWSRLDDSGLLGIAVPEDQGGAGLGLEEVLLLLEEQGKQVVAIPLWGHLVATLALAEAKAAGLAADGPMSLSVPLDGGEPGLVPGSPDAVVGVDEQGCFFARVSSLGNPVETTDHSLAFEPQLGERERLAISPDWLRDVARLGLCAQQLGNVDAGVREAAHHLTGREQFGRPLATFQATTQQLGDAYCDVQAMRATLWQAAFTMQRRDVDVACWWAADAGERAQHIVQHLHGGLGADITYPVHRRLLLTMRINAFLGGPSRQLVRLGASVVSA
jgi:alkylation response protein AidB-like acyl-CoA dehydrogenase